MDLLAYVEHGLAALSLPAGLLAFIHFRRAEHHLGERAQLAFQLTEARTHVGNLQKALRDAVNEADSHKAELDTVKTQRANALARAAEVNRARAAERQAKREAAQTEARVRTLTALNNIGLRRRDEVVADIIRDRTGV